MTGPALEVRRAADRFHTRLDWLDSWHSFSFGPHVDPANTHHGLLVVNNDDVIGPGGGFGTHPHRDTGNHGVIGPGLAQRMSAGRGIRHSEVNASAATAVHLVQMWVLPDTTGIDPGYEQRDLSDVLVGGGLVPVASGAGHDGAVRIHQRDAVLWVARLAEGETVVVPDAAHVHVYVARGTASLGTPDEHDEAIRLATGDAARLTAGSAAGARPLTGAPGGCEALIWATA
jgi:redox-sensitive bicupin YhaK (pirin superfamily)